MKSILFQKKETIGYIVLNRPKQRNALSSDLMIEFQKILDIINKNNSIQIIIVKGNGKDFCAGHDLNELQGTNYDIHHFRKIFSLSSSLMQKLHSISKPVIAQIQGNATAAGCQLIASCDLAIAERNAKFSTPGVKIGLFCSTPMVPLSRNIGRKKAFEMLFTGKSISADEAKQYGLINRVVDMTILDQETEKLAKEITQYSSDTIKIGKKGFYNQIDHLEIDAYNYAKEVISLNCLSNDAQEGIKAMLQKRKPKWEKDKEKSI